MPTELKRVEVQQGERRTSDEVEDDGVINANRVEASRCFVSIPEQWENS